MKAQISGILYRSPAPELPPFVDPGTAVTKGQTLALLESMKLFSKIKAPAAGIVVEILGQNGEPVNAGQVLFVLQRVQSSVR